MSVSFFLYGSGFSDFCIVYFDSSNILTAIEFKTSFVLIGVVALMLSISSLISSKLSLTLSSLSALMVSSPIFTSISDS